MGIYLTIAMQHVTIIKSFCSLWSIGYPWRASRHCGLQLSPWPRSMIFLCFLSHPLLSFATFSSAHLSFYIPEDSNLMWFSLLLLFLYVMYVQSNSIFFFLSDFLLASDWWFSTPPHAMLMRYTCQPTDDFRLLIRWRRVLLEKLTSSQLVKKFPA